MARKTLDEIGLEHGTDKASKSHGYLTFYEKMIGHLRDEQITLLEVGVYRGASIKMWVDYFRNGTVYGADLRPAGADIDFSKYNILRADQGSLLDLTRLGREYGPFDVAIDDGSHKWDHQLVTLRTLLPFVKPGGYYILEDLHTSLPERQESFKGLAQYSTVEFLMKLTELVCFSSTAERAANEPDPFLRAFMAELDFIAWHASTVVMRRKVLKNPIATMSVSMPTD